MPGFLSPCSSICYQSISYAYLSSINLCGLTSFPMMQICFVFGRGGGPGERRSEGWTEQRGCTCLRCCWFCVVWVAPHSSNSWLLLCGFRINVLFVVKTTPVALVPPHKYFTWHPKMKNPPECITIWVCFQKQNYIKRKMIARW